MKNLILFLLFLICSFSYADAQPQPNPEATPPEEKTQTIRKQEESRRRFEAFRTNGEYSRNINNSARMTALQTIRNIYREPTKTEAKLLLTDKEDQKKYAQILRQPNTGLTKLILDKGCAEYTDVLNVSEECLRYTMPGAGSSFSFRKGNYTIQRLADLTYRKDGLYSPAILSHALLVNIGDFPLDQVTMQTGGLSFVKDFQINTDFEKAVEIDKKIIRGIENDGFFYSRGSKVEENSTYVLRVIAYRGSYFRAMQGFVFDELDFDERRDVTVAFRVVNRDDDSVTILWKTITNQKSPAIKKPAQEKQDGNKLMAGKRIKNEN